MVRITEMEIRAERARLMVLMAIAVEDARKKAKLSKTALAKKMKISPYRLSQILEGLEEISLEMFVKFGLACNTYWTWSPHTSVKV